MSVEQVQDAQTHSSPQVVFERMIQATNRHDLDAMLQYFAPDFRSEQPCHPERAFTGRAGVRKNWSFFFTTVPDMQVDILNAVEEGDTVWAELHYRGMQTDSKKFTVKGVTMMGIQADQIIWARLYIEPVQESH
jgi:ketosteroid isomerase-like protein